MSKVCDIDFNIIDEIRNDKKLYNIIEYKSLNITDSRIIKTHESTRPNTQFNMTHIMRILDRSLTMGKNLNMSLKRSNFVIAGGLFSQNAINSVDVFIIGNHDIKYRIHDFISNRYGNAWVSDNCITLLNDDINIYIALKYYDSIQDLLNSFDLGSSMICYDGENILLNAEGKFAYETGYNIVNLNKYNYSYKFRLEKYYNREFGILHTNLKDKYGFSFEKEDLIEKSQIQKFSDNCYNVTSMLKNIKNIQSGVEKFYIRIFRTDLLNDNFETNIYDGIFWIFESVLCDHIKKNLEELKLLAEDEIDEIMEHVTEDIKNSVYNHACLKSYIKDVLDYPIETVIVPYEIKNSLADPLSKSEDFDKFYKDGYYVDHTEIKIALK